MDTSFASTISVARPALRKIVSAGALAAVLGIVLNILIWIVGNALGGMTIPFVAVPIVMTLGMTAGGIIYALLTRFTKQPDRLFTIVSVVFLVVYAAVPVSAMQSAPGPGMAQFNLITMLATQLMHIVGGALAIWAYTRRTRA